jgi:hypothetical protein
VDLDLPVQGGRALIEQELGTGGARQLVALRAGATSRFTPVLGLPDGIIACLFDLDGARDLLEGS